MGRFEFVAAAAAALALASGSAGAAGPAHGLTAKQVAAIDRYVTAELARQRIPGAEVGVFVDGRTLLAKGYGLANLELGVPVRPQTLMQSGSVGKQFAATAVMMLVEQGKVGLEDSVRKYFPEAPESWAPIRIKNLLSHTAGLPEYEEGAMARPGGEFDLTRDFTEDELAAKLFKLPLEYKPGDSWAYRNSDYLLLGILIHRVTGRFYGDYLHDRIFAPLGMTSTRVISDVDIIPGRSAGYEIKGGRLKNQAWVSATFNSTADGTLYFNVGDLAKWDRALDEAGLLSAASWRRMWTPFVLNDGKPNSAGYGFAWAMGEVNGHRVVKHSGAWQGFTSQVTRYPDDRLTVVVLTNLDAGHARPRQIERVVAGMVRPALMPKPNPAIEDHDPALAQRLQGLMARAVAGQDLTGEFAAGSGYRFEADDGSELAASLPKDWDKAPWSLIRRTESGGVTSVSYRIGRPGDTRVLSVRLDGAGKILVHAVVPDPDVR